MIQKLLGTCLGPVIRAEQTLRLRRLYAALFFLGAIGAALLATLALLLGWWSWPALYATLGALLLAALIGRARIQRNTPDLRSIARQVEEKHPDLRSALLAAMDQEPNPDGELSFLQRRLLGEISEHAIQNQWVRNVSGRRLAIAGLGQFLALILFVGALWFLLGSVPSSDLSRETSSAGSAGSDSSTTTPAAIALRVTPGDVELEKGSRLVIEAIFSGRAPTSASLLHRHKGGETTIPMQVGLDDAVFSTLIPKIDTDGSYQVYFEDQHSDEFLITTFTFPELTQVDAIVTPPPYLEKEKETILDTRKITVMEHSDVEWHLRVNKPVVAAELFSETGEILSLTPDPNDPTLLIASHTPETTQRYRVHLVDEQDRSNRRPPWLTVNVKENLPPTWKLTFPGRDFEVSALQELPLEAEVWDDVAVLRTGMTYRYQGEETEVVLTDTPLPGNEKHPLATLIDIESLGAKEREFLSYYFWAEDHDSRGQVRRSASDQFFAEIRLFEDILREGAPGGGEGGSPATGEAAELIRIQKDILNAAWKLVREEQLGKSFAKIADDVAVVAESQQVVILKVEETLPQVEDPEVREAFAQAKDFMQEALREFSTAHETQSAKALLSGLNHAKEAYAELLKARARETEISMSRNASSSAAQSSQERQRNLNLELEQKELKYEEQSLAQNPAQSAEQEENLAVLKRLKDLARRQEAIAEKIKELENQYQNADAEEKAEIERQLQRLREEQKELLRELDDLSERMDSEQNRTNMSEERERLSEARESIQKASENLDSGEFVDAANAATRAQEQLNEMKEEFREKTARQFTKEMSELREAARALTAQQERISQSLDQLTDNPPDDPFTQSSEQERAELAQTISAQSTQFEQMLEAMRRLSEQSDLSEPLLSNALYEAVRNATMNEIGNSLDEARNMLFYNRPEQARDAEKLAARGIEELKERIEQAAEKILDSESNALRLARSELDQLIEEAKAEADRLTRSENGNSLPSTPDQSGTSADEATVGEKGKLAEAGKEPGEEPGQGMASTPNTEGQEQTTLAQEGSPTDAKGESPNGPQPGKGTGENNEDKGTEKGESATTDLADSGKGEAKGKSPSKGGENAEGERSPRSPGGGSGRGGALSTDGDDLHRGLPQGTPFVDAPFFEQASEQREPGPITGEDYEPWSDRLGDIEEMLSQEELRNSIAKVRDDARSMRIDFRRNHLVPAAATIQQRITKPLLELRQQISEELAKLNRENPLTPIDRDPVPSEFRDLVRRYYEELGAGN